MPATAALRADIVAPSPEQPMEQPEWFLTTTLLEHASWHSGSSAQRAVEQALEVGQKLVQRDSLERIMSDEWPTERSGYELFLVLAEQMEHAGFLNLAACSLDALESLNPNTTPVQLGRILAQRARVASKQGKLEEAYERFLRLEKFSREANSDELKARAAVGLSALAQVRGNYPELQRLSRRALRFARRTRIRALLRHAHGGLMIAAGIAGDLPRALEHGWDMYSASVGDPDREAEVLQNLGQALLDAGQPALARAAFSVVVSRRLKPRVILPALGGLALASALTERRDSVHWATLQVERTEENAVPRYALASALLECAIALASVGSLESAEQFRARAASLGEAHGFHEVVMRAEELLQASKRPIPSGLGARAEKAARALTWMEPEILPESVRMSLVG